MKLSMMLAQTPGRTALVALALLGIIFVLFVIHRLGLWMDRHGWIYYRKRPEGTGGGGATAGILNEFQKIVEPQVEHRIQVMEERNESIGQRGRGDDIGKLPPDGPSPK